MVYPTSLSYSDVHWGLKVRKKFVSETMKFVFAKATENFENIYDTFKLTMSNRVSLS